MDIEESQVPESLKIVLYRVLQEAFTNIAGHSNVDLIRFSLGKRNDKIEMIIENNGDGFDSEDTLREDESGGGLGLLGVRERIELSGGSLEIKSSKKTGMTIRASWSLQGFQHSTKK